RSHAPPSVSSTERSQSFHRTPALLYRMWSAPKVRTPSSTIRRTSSSAATSPIAASASPPARLTSATVSPAAAPSMSQTTMRAPSAAKSRAASRPMPIPAPVISATLFASLPAIRRSDALEVSDQLPVRDHLVERLLLEPAMVQIVLDHLVAEGFPRGARALQLLQPLAEGLRDLGDGRVLVRVALVQWRALELLLHAMEPRCDGGGESQVRVGVGAGNAVFHP